MIFDRILDVVHDMVRWLLGGILNQPDVTASSGFGNSASHIMAYIAAWPQLLPTEKIFLGLSLVVVVETAVLGFVAVKFIYKKIPGIK